MNAKNRKVFIWIGVIVIGIIVVSTLSILVYTMGVKHNRYQYCLDLYGTELDFQYLPSYDEASVQEKQEDGGMRYSYISGDWYVVYEEDDCVIFYSAFSRQIRQYDHGTLTEMQVERDTFGQSVYDTYKIG